jgi:hypothetical protein
MEMAEIQERFKLVYDFKTCRRIIAKKEVIIHCHHYNSRIQNTMEGARQVDGKSIILSSAESVFSEYITNIFESSDNEEDKWQIVGALYAHLGYGKLDFSQINQNIITAQSSHFVQGWLTGFEERDKPVCTFTEGFLQGAIFAVTGEVVYVKEQSCMIADEKECYFVIERNRHHPIAHYEKKSFAFQPKELASIENSNIDEQKIVNALIEMPFYGNEKGLIPIFGVYLAAIPADFYNLVCIRFAEEMHKKSMFYVAKRLLINSAESCAMNTFRGILNSKEWCALVEPMVKTQEDELFGIIAVSNALGWGNWHIIKLIPQESLILQSLNGYESLGFREYREESRTHHCFMLTGVAAGIMALVYGEGTIKERFGIYFSGESSCITCGDPSCVFEVEKV